LIYLALNLAGLQIIVAVQRNRTLRHGRDKV